MWPDQDTQSFYENLIDIHRVAALKHADSGEQPEESESNLYEEEFLPAVNDSIDAIDMSELTHNDDVLQADDKVEQEAVDDEEASDDEQPSLVAREKLASPGAEEPNLVGLQDAPTEPGQISAFLDRLSNAINRDLADKCAAEFVSELNRKGNRKRLIQHILNVPTNRLDLLPFLGRFLATIKPVVAEVPMKIAHELLTKFRSVAEKKYEPPKRGEKRKDLFRIDMKIHMSSFIAELVGFSFLRQIGRAHV